MPWWGGWVCEDHTSSQLSLCFQHPFHSCLFCTGCVAGRIPGQRSSDESNMTLSQGCELGLERTHSAQKALERGFLSSKKMQGKTPCFLPGIVGLDKGSKLRLASTPTKLAPAENRAGTSREVMSKSLLQCQEACHGGPRPAAVDQYIAK